MAKNRRLSKGALCWCGFPGRSKGGTSLAASSSATAKAKTEVKKIAKTASDTAKQHSQHRKDFVKGISPTKKEKKIVKGVGSAVKKSLTREEVLKEEEYDRMRDKHLERGGIGAVASHSNRKPNYGKPQTAAQKKNLLLVL